MDRVAPNALLQPSCFLFISWGLALMVRAASGPALPVRCAPVRVLKASARYSALGSGSARAAAASDAWALVWASVLACGGDPDRECVLVQGYALARDSVAEIS